MSEWNIHAFSSSADREGFDCGVAPLNRYFEKQIGQDVRRKACASYVVTRRGSDCILGYYTISASSVHLATLPIEVVKKLPRYPHVPAFLIGRLAVSRDEQGNGLGRILVMDALLRCLDLSAEVGAALVLVDAKDKSASNFYRRFQFIPLDTTRLFLPITTVANLL